MSLTRLLARNLAIANAPLLDDEIYGDEIRDWAHATNTPAKGLIDQRSTTEQYEGRDAFVGDWFAMLFPGAPVDGASRIIDLDSGQAYEVTGDPWPVNTPRGVHHLQVDLLTVDG